jgi:DNA replication protein DnaC
MGNLFYITSDQVAEIKQNTIGVTCEGTCQGTGFLLKGFNLEDCTCSKDFLRVVSYVGSGIPKKYWDFDLRHLIPEFLTNNKISLSIIDKFRTDIQKATDQGIGLYIQGASGVAKTSLAFYIMKTALDKDIPCYAIRMSQLTKLLFESLTNEDKKQQLDFIKNTTKLLLIDEIEKDYNVGDTGKFAGTQVNEFFSYIYDSQKSLIITSNLPKAELRHVHAFNIIDRLQELIDVILVGESFRNYDTNLQKLMNS